MFLKTYRDEEYNQIKKTGNNLDALILELEDKAEKMDFKLVNLEDQAIANIDRLVYHGSEYETVDEFKMSIWKLKMQCELIYGILRQIKEAVKKDKTSKLKIITID